MFSLTIIMAYNINLKIYEVYCVRLIATFMSYCYVYYKSSYKTELPRWSTTIKTK